jgi:hypothetical protein
MKYKAVVSKASKIYELIHQSIRSLSAYFQETTLIEKNEHSAKLRIEAWQSPRSGGFHA